MKSDPQKYDKPKRRTVENIIHNFSSYKLTPEEEHALSFSLDDHISTNQNDVKIKTEFESFSYQILKHTNQLDQRRQDELKSKIRRTSENYSRIKVPYKYQKIIDNISRNKDIILIKQDKGRGVVILDKKDYIEKCINILDSKQFEKLKKDPTKTLENKMLRTLRIIKKHLDENEYRRMYPTGSRPGLFYTTAKVHKLQSGEGLNELTMRPIVSNIGTATYETAKFLNSLLAPLGKSDRSILNTEAFVKQVKGQRIPEGYKMISFDVKNLFTNVPLKETVDIILTKVYDEKKIDTKIPKSILKELRYLCTKHVHFKFNNEIYIQCDGVAMGSPLGPLLANIFMISLEDNTLPKLELYLRNWKRYVDDTFAYVLPDKIEMVLHEINSYHSNIKLTYELEL